MSQASTLSSASRRIYKAPPRHEPSDRLTRCKLWEGSILHTMHKCKALTRELVAKQRDAMRRYDDITPAEVQFRNALIAELE